MKKYMYAGILLGAMVLAGCSANYKSEEQIQVTEKVTQDVTQDVTNRQEPEVRDSPNTDKEGVLRVTPLELTQEQKEDYYKQYVEIVEKVNSDYDKDLELIPLEEFKPEEWVTPEDFEQIATDRATIEFTSKAFGGDPVE
ncbi:putative periplasmic lipoprotein [Aneurinibacillus sp. REN35]|uniref:hypothetical protein n=1 Tax=Aneurinibacillus sp. REN35 TaxID=3237286 RepID=UPI003526D3A9